MKDKILDLLKKLNLIPADKQKDLEVELESLNLDSFVPDINDNIHLPSNTDDGTKKLIAELINQNRSLQGSVKNLQDALVEEKKQRELAIQSEQQRLENEKNKKIQDSIKKLLDENKITEADKETWEKLFIKDYENAEKIASGLKVIGDVNNKKNITKNIDTEKNNNNNKLSIDRTALKNAISEQMQNYNN